MNSSYSDELTFIPQPKLCERRIGEFSLNRILRLSCSPEAEGPARVLAAALQGVPQCQVEQTVERISSEGTSIRLELTEPEGKTGETYQLEIRPEQIEATGALAGLHNAVATLRQLIHHGGNAALPALHIEDKPSFSWRGILFDSSRHFFRKETVLKYLDVLSLFKFNRFHWHLTDDQGWRLEILRYPRLTEVGAWRGPANARYGGFYSQEDVREIVAYANDRGIMVVPEIDVPGHATAILAAYPEYGCGNKTWEVETGWGIFQNNLNAGDEKVYDFIENIMEEVVELFPSPYIHLGADECQKGPWRDCPECQTKIREEELADENELQSYFIGRVLKMLEKHNRTGIGWDEILEGGPPGNIIVQSWQQYESTLAAARTGHATIASPKFSCYLDYAVSCIDLERVFRFNPIPDELEKDRWGLILGGECNLWTEYISEQNIDHMAFPRLLGLSEALWQGGDPEARSYDDFLQRVEASYPLLKKLGINYGPTGTTIPRHADAFMGRTDLA